MFSTLLPQIGSLGIVAYWLIFLFAFLDAIPVVCIFIPGLFVVMFGGVFVQQGILELGEVFWFAVCGNFLGAGLSYVLAGRISRYRQFTLGPVLSHMAVTIRKYGGLGLIIGCFSGPLSGFSPFVVGLTKMPFRSFLLWSFPASMISRGVFIAFGYYFSHIVSKLTILSSEITYSTLALLFVLFVLWWIILSIKYFWPTLRDFSRELVKNIGQRPPFLRWQGQHPKTARFLKNRLHLRDFSGLPLSLFVLFFLYLTVIAVDAGFELSRSSFLLELDERVSLLMHAYWNLPYIDFFTSITNVGNSKTVVIFLTAIEIYLIAKGRYAFAAGLFVAVVGDTLSVNFIKELVARPRPYGSYYIETSYSFPSGHAGISVAFYGTLAYLLWRVRTIPLFWGLGLAASLATLIGFSRIYLLEHYLSDVVNGWMIGAIWMCIGIVLGEQWALKYPQREKTAALKWAGTISFILLIYGLFYIFTYDPPHRYTPTPEKHTSIASVSEIFQVKNLPVTTESIAGTPFEPINIIIEISNDTELIKLFKKSGWSMARPAGFQSLSLAALSAWTKSADTTAPITPYFWNKKPNDYGFQKPTKEDTLTKRHHIRIWDSGFVLPDNMRVYLGAASFDDGLQWGVLHHIDPNLDKERDFVAQSLTQGGDMSRGNLSLTPPRKGTNIAGNSWNTDGKAALIRPAIIPGNSTVREKGVHNEK